MPSYQRTVDAVALARTVEGLDEIVAASFVVKIVERYVREQWLGEVRKNARVMALAGLKVGGTGIPWRWGTPDGRKRSKDKLYLQSVDRYRAQAVLDDPKAKWEMYYGTTPSGVYQGQAMVRRVA